MISSSVELVIVVLVAVVFVFPAEAKYGREASKIRAAAREENATTFGSIR